MIYIRRTILFCVFFVLLISCKQQSDISPNLIDIRQVCDLATQECYYRNLVTIEKNGLQQWIEYESTVKLGIDISSVNIEVNKSKVIVTIPNAKIIGEPKISIPSMEVLSEMPGFIEGLFKARISSKDQVDALEKARNNCITTLQENHSLMQNAQTRAMKIIENYVRQIGELTGKQYQIEWKFIKSEE
ncbi:MAG: DUF4230 domain-containing protein [Spirochaetales bacterium]|nr:DUF4230 domain-containing protein [Spirochaetales bacterium]